MIIGYILVAVFDWAFRNACVGVEECSWDTAEAVVLGVLAGGAARRAAHALAIETHFCEASFVAL